MEESKKLPLGSPGVLGIQYLRAFNIGNIWYFNTKNWVILTNFVYKVYHAFSNVGILHEFEFIFGYIGCFFSDILVFHFPPWITLTIPTIHTVGNSVKLHSFGI